MTTHDDNFSISVPDIAVRGV